VLLQSILSQDFLHARKWYVANGLGNHVVLMETQRLPEAYIVRVLQFGTDRTLSGDRRSEGEKGHPVEMSPCGCI
jgi:hypothetical protein